MERRTLIFNSLIAPCLAAAAGSLRVGPVHGTQKTFSERMLGDRFASFEPTGPQPLIVTPQGNEVRPYLSSHALLIGNSRYRAPGWRDLAAVPSEMTKVREALQKHGFGVWSISDATSQEMRVVLADFSSQFGFIDEGRLLVFFAGHGVTDEKTDHGYLVPVDASDDPKKMIKTLFSVLEVDSVARQIKSAHALFCFDSCFSGSIVNYATRGGPLDHERQPSTDRWRYLRDAARHPIRQFISAGGANESVSPSSDFVPAFLRAISGAANRGDDTYVTGREIGHYITVEVMRTTNGKQKPISGTSRVATLSGGDIVFQVPPHRVDIKLSLQSPLLLRDLFAKESFLSLVSQLRIDPWIARYAKFEVLAAGAVVGKSATLQAVANGTLDLAIWGAAPSLSDNLVSLPCGGGEWLVINKQKFSAVPNGVRSGLYRVCGERQAAIPS